MRGAGGIPCSVRRWLKVCIFFSDSFTTDTTLHLHQDLLMWVPVLPLLLPTLLPQPWLLPRLLASLPPPLLALPLPLPLPLLLLLPRSQ